MKRGNPTETNSLSPFGECAAQGDIQAVGEFGGFRGYGYETGQDEEWGHELFSDVANQGFLYEPPSFLPNQQLWTSASEPTESVPTTQSPERKVGTIAPYFINECINSKTIEFGGLGSH